MKIFKIHDFEHKHSMKCFADMCGSRFYPKHCKKCDGIIHGSYIGADKDSIKVFEKCDGCDWEKTVDVN